LLVDARVWVYHFRRRNAEPVDLMTQDRVLAHRFVPTELACGKGC
jgi:hypothetical protein